MPKDPSCSEASQSTLQDRVSISGTLKRDEVELRHADQEGVGTVVARVATSDKLWAHAPNDTCAALRRQSFTTTALLLQLNEALPRPPFRPPDRHANVSLAKPRLCAILHPLVHPLIVHSLSLVQVSPEDSREQARWNIGSDRTRKLDAAQFTTRKQYCSGFEDTRLVSCIITENMSAARAYLEHSSRHLISHITLLIARSSMYEACCTTLSTDGKTDRFREETPHGAPLSHHEL
ncbi:hypothetical protein J1614_007758 [Plenodomus biglobosus]|nr:hypothetical protein J1614_007758 [Plenodomus biglobosus]